MQVFKLIRAATISSFRFGTTRNTRHRFAPCTVDLDDAIDQELEYAADFADIMGQEHVKRAMEIAAAGGHNAMALWTTTRRFLSYGQPISKKRC